MHKSWHPLNKLPLYVKNIAIRSVLKFVVWPSTNSAFHSLLLGYYASERVRSSGGLVGESPRALARLSPVKLAYSGLCSFVMVKWVASLSLRDPT